MHFRSCNLFLELNGNEKHLKIRKTRAHSEARRRRAELRRRTRRWLNGWPSWAGSGVHGPGVRSRARGGGRGTTATTGAGPAASSRAGRPSAASYGQRMARRGPGFGREGTQKLEEGRHEVLMDEKWPEKAARRRAWGIRRRRPWSFKIRQRGGLSCMEKGSNGCTREWARFWCKESTCSSPWREETTLRSMVVVQPDIGEEGVRSRCTLQEGGNWDLEELGEALAHLPMVGLELGWPGAGVSWELRGEAAMAALWRKEMWQREGEREKKGIKIFSKFPSRSSGFPLFNLPPVRVFDWKFTGVLCKCGCTFLLLGSW